MPPRARQREREEPEADRRRRSAGSSAPSAGSSRSRARTRSGAAPGTGRRRGARRRCRRASPTRRAAPLLLVPREHRDARQLADPARQDGVREEADAERREDRAERAAGGGGIACSITRCQAAARATTDRRLSAIASDDPLPVDEPEGVGDEVPLGPAPDERARSSPRTPGRSAPSRPQVAPRQPHAATALRERGERLVDLGEPLRRSRPTSSALAAIARAARPSCSRAAARPRAARRPRRRARPGRRGGTRRPASGSMTPR